MKTKRITVTVPAVMAESFADLARSVTAQPVEPTGGVVACFLGTIGEQTGILVASPGANPVLIVRACSRMAGSASRYAEKTIDESLEDAVKRGAIHPDQEQSSKEVLFAEFAAGAAWTANRAEFHRSADSIVSRSDQAAAAIRDKKGGVQ